ncbi:MAG: AAA family ATPase, partial [Nitrosotalea sp.]
MSSAALALEGVAGKFAAEAIRQDGQGDRNAAINSYQRAIDALVKLIQLFPDNTLNPVYEQHCTQYKKRINELQNSPDGHHSQNDNNQLGPSIHANSSNQTINSNIENMIIKEKPNVSWKEVIGLEDVKTALRESIVYPAKKPELFTLGWPRGILLYGPPGCGKTMLAAATASEINGYFINVDAASMMSKWLGDAEKNVSQLFHMARDSSKKENVPVIMLIDEVDSLLGNSQNENGGEIRVKNQFLTEMDG